MTRRIQGTPEAILLPLEKAGQAGLRRKSPGPANQPSEQTVEILNIPDGYTYSNIYVPRFNQVLTYFNLTLQVEQA